MRVAFLAGRRAMADYIRCSEAAHGAAEKLSTGVENLVNMVGALQEKLRQAEYDLAQCRKAQLLSQTGDMLAGAETLPDGTRLVAAFVEADGALLRDLASKLIEAPKVVALLGAMNGESAMYVFGRSADVEIGMGTLMQMAAKPLGGKGGGRPDFAQGGGCREILDAACGFVRSWPW